MDETTIARYDNRNGYCRMLGHTLPFRYCRTMNNGLPCSRLPDCWFELLPIEQFIREHYTETEQHQFLGTRPSRWHTLVTTLNRLHHDPHHPRNE